MQAAAGLAAPANPGASLTPEEQALLDKLQPRWSVMFSTRAGAGYKDNLALSHMTPERSGFVRGGLDVFLWHPPRISDGRADYSAYLMGEGTHFFSGETVDHEAMASALLEWRYQVPDLLKFSLNASGLYLDQVLDESDTDLQRVVVQSKKTVPMFGPTLRWSPRKWWWLEAHGEGRRERYRDGFNDANVGAAALKVGWQPASRFEAAISGEETHRRFVSREQYSAGGRPQAGTSLRITEREGEARFDITWDRASRWKTTTRLSVLDYADNGSGYFNYRQRRVRQKLAWKEGEWRATLEGSAKRIDFEVVTVGVGIAPPLRVQDKFTSDLHIERQLSKQWSVYAEYSWERSRCNDPIASYRMNEGLLGAVWSWEK